MTSASPDISGKNALVVGLGGLGCPAAIALARAGIGCLHLCDDDQVSESNLHRQVLYTDEDVDADKLSAAEARLRDFGAREVVLHRTRLLPENALQLVADRDVVIEGADNFATKFLAADACHLKSVPIVHGAAVRFVGTALAVSPSGRPCYRCLFEDLLDDSQAPNCSEAGVMGPVVGVVGALLADLALDILGGDSSRLGQVHSFDGKAMKMRAAAIHARPGCTLCDEHASSSITHLTRELYRAAPVCTPAT